MYGDLRGYIHRRTVELQTAAGKTEEEATALADANADRLHADALEAINAARTADPEDPLDFIQAWQSSVQETIDAWISALN
jgi:hypothetical protein